MRAIAAIVLGLVVVTGGVPADALAKKPRSTMSAKLDSKKFKSKLVVVNRMRTSFEVSSGPTPKSLRALIRTITFICEVNLGALVTPATLTQANMECGAEYRESHIGVPTQKRWPSSVFSVTFTKIAGQVVQGEFEGTFDPDDTHPGDRSHTVTKGKFSVVLKNAVN